MAHDLDRLPDDVYDAARSVRLELRSVQKHLRRLNRFVTDFGERLEAFENARPESEAQREHEPEGSRSTVRPVG